MTGELWKKIVLQAAETVSVNPYLMEEIDNPIQDTRESVSVLLEVLPTLSPKRIEKALTEIREQEIEPTEKDLQKKAVKRLEAKTEREIELLDAQILEMAMEQLNQVSLIDISPSYHYHD